MISSLFLQNLYLGIFSKGRVDLIFDWETLLEQSNYFENQPTALTFYLDSSQWI